MRRPVAFVLLTVTMLAGCNSEAAAPPRLPSASPAKTSEASASPSAIILSVPHAAQEPTPQGASAFARHWIDELNEAARTGDTTRLRALGHPECEACRNFADSIESLYMDGGGIQGGVFSVIAAESPGDDDPDTALVSLVYDVTPTAQLAKDGSVSREIPALEAEVGDMTLVRDGSGWLLREFSDV